ncbi:ATP-binding protein [Ktedonospora formicarum]|uniref:histidine kinase n=1 Tax=Ktedonospora formicarum TaxID=2778364 RepID=A0A8J3I8J2_9CHLR|nr:ATP-binding protein [Ktedonospora formicarum]GHO48795.1 hypothetical protein KSX_69580 [Ktedonospora formicarum]
MRTPNEIAPLPQVHMPTWASYLLDTVLAFVGSMLMTGIIALFHLFPRIPNISMIYLLIVLGLATWRSRYAAILTSLVAFLSFDFFVIPPLYTFVMYRTEEWISLSVLLFSGILTGHLAAALRQQAQQTTRQERETRILYDLVRLINQEGKPEQQLKVIARAIVNVFTSWGIYDCDIVQPDTRGTMRVQASACQEVDHVHLLPGENSQAAWVLKHGRPVATIIHASPLTIFPQHILQRFFPATIRGPLSQHMIYQTQHVLPLLVGANVVGVVRLHMQEDDEQFKHDDFFEKHQEKPDTRIAFFWTFLDHASILIEQTRLQHENLKIEVLQRTDALRAALLSSVSHDLRTPLTVIKASASSFLEKDIHWDEETQRSIARSIEHEADRLNRLVGNLLDMSRIEEGALKPEKEWYQMTALIQDVLSRLSSLLDGREVLLHFPGDIPPVELDYLFLDQVLTNVLENAVRYTPPFTPIEIEVYQQAQELVVSIADHGPGVSEDERELIFNKFYRVLNKKEASADEAYATGSGLGLAVCKGLIETHDGRIWIEQCSEGGAIFFLTLPLGTYGE